ncbi:hypothetical protein A7E78_02325 [Syntrophotalea acetylenivorans]|uniref:KfrA N-terminal DNA-binding domain-containing protein n=1 Tax=Syntrophotalea acetylenivorans TaxID=1842532 RepID=A0A1L3GLM3_9BACT|nr:DNA-binding protein [Syntrophotalea acetylenivorans]APG26791.1 hypothetical protein A7E78_02325 [Syntrophotalea acetylenivorans]
MPRKGIRYEQVAEACAVLEKSQQLSVRAIQARTGGSMTTVLKHYRRWQRERSGQAGVETTISDRLRHALLSELEEAAAQARHAGQKEIKEAQQQIDQLKKETEKKQLRFAQQFQIAQQQKRLLEKKLLDAEQRAATAEKQLRSAQDRLNTAQKSLQRERRKQLLKGTILQKAQDLKPVGEDPTPGQEQKDQVLEESPKISTAQKKAPATKKPKKKVQQSLFDF